MTSFCRSQCKVKMLGENNFPSQKLLRMSREWQQSVKPHEGPSELQPWVAVWVTDPWLTRSVLVQWIFVFTYFKVQSSEDIETLYGRFSGLRQDCDFSIKHQRRTLSRGVRFYRSESLIERSQHHSSLFNDSSAVLLLCSSHYGCN